MAGDAPSTSATPAARRVPPPSSRRCKEWRHAEPEIVLYLHAVAAAAVYFPAPGLARAQTAGIPAPYRRALRFLSRAKRAAGHLAAHRLGGRNPRRAEPHRPSARDLP